MESAVELLEEVVTRSDGTSPSMSFVFRKILEEENDKALDKCKTLTHTMCIDRNEKYEPTSKMIDFKIEEYKNAI